MINGKTLLGWGWEPGPKMGEALKLAKQMERKAVTLAVIKEELEKLKPAPIVRLSRKEKGLFAEAIQAETDEEIVNLEGVRRHMHELMKTPTLSAGAVMPDACPSGHAHGTIPVGGAVISNAIHPAFHSADVCCSMWVTLFDHDHDTTDFMNALQASTRFGPGGRKRSGWLNDPVLDPLNNTTNYFLQGMYEVARGHLADQGDGNHFAYVGELEADETLIEKMKDNGYEKTAGVLKRKGKVKALVTHHGSRGLGVRVYKRGMHTAKMMTHRISPETPEHQAWIPFDTDEGQAYWVALQYVADWTRRNHQLIHERTAAKLRAQMLDSFGNEHNFVWRRGEDFYHGKGATPAWRKSDGTKTIGVIPLNMAQPILLTFGNDQEKYCSFSPHGAGRNKSRTQMMREAGVSHETSQDKLAELCANQTEGLDIRFYCGKIDLSETPMAYKDAEAVQRQIDHYDLADVAGLIRPLGCIMAGDYDKPWLIAKQKKREAARLAATS